MPIWRVVAPPYLAEKIEREIIICYLGSNLRRWRPYMEQRESRGLLQILSRLSGQSGESGLACWIQLMKWQVCRYDNHSNFRLFFCVSGTGVPGLKNSEKKNLKWRLCNDRDLRINLKNQFRLNESTFCFLTRKKNGYGSKTRLLR